MDSCIYIAGTGNLASAIGMQFKNGLPNGFKFGGWLSRNPELTPLLPCHSYSFEGLKQGDIVFLCVQDRQIFEVANRFQGTQVYLIHCSGTQPLEKAGVFCHAAFWPMQTFRNGNHSVWKNVPVFIETTHEILAERLSKLVEAMDSKVVLCNGEQRMKMHLTAILANNFTNALIRAAEKTATSAGFTTDLIHPIIQQTVLNAVENGAQKSQTGPALRGDEETIHKHMELLENDPELLKVYTNLTSYISMLFK